MDAPSHADRVTDIAYVALGSNLGDRDQHLRDARERIAALDHVEVIGASRIEETAPIGPVEQGAYLNQMLALRTTLTPAELLAHLLEIEQAGGRVRTIRWGPRTIDLDIVQYLGATCDTPSLTVPHPQLSARDFWQRELAELASVHL